MAGERSIRVAEQIHRLLSSRLIPALRDPRLGFATITSVDLSADLKSARVFVTIYEENPAKKKLALDALNHATGWFRREIGRELRLRHVPSLRFDEDTSVERAARIERIISEIHPGDGGDESE